MRILVVEDHPTLGRDVKTYLESRTYAVDLVTTGEDALFQGLNLPYDLIILDIMLPDISGLDVCRRLRRGLTLQVQTGESVTVLGDEARLIQVVMNLLDNAIRYTDTGGCVTLSITSNEQHACLTVRDTGRGISPEHLPHIFERFYRVNPAHEQTEDGNSGLGLSIVKWVIEAHGGTVTVESQVGQGSLFLMTLPLHLHVGREPRDASGERANKGVRGMAQKIMP